MLEKNFSVDDYIEHVLSFDPLEYQIKNGFDIQRLKEDGYGNLIESMNFRTGFQVQLKFVSKNVL